MVSGDVRDHMRGDSEYLLVSLGGLTFGIDVRSVGPITEMSPITRVPQTPSFMLGVGLIHGGIYSIVDIRPLLGFSTDESSDESTPFVCVFIGPEYRCGVAIESVGDILRIPASAVDNRDESIPYVRGVFRRESADVVHILDVSALFACAEMTQFR